MSKIEIDNDIPSIKFQLVHLDFESIYSKLYFSGIDIGELSSPGNLKGLEPVIDASLQPRQTVDEMCSLAEYPKDWHFVKDDLLFFKIEYLPSKMVFLKSVKVDQSGTVQYYVRGKSCFPDFLSDSFTKIQELNDILKNFDVIPFCPGCPEEELQLLKEDCTKIGQKKKQTWRSKSCELLCCPGQNRCGCCTILKKILVRKSSTATKQKKSRTEVRNHVKKNRRLNSKIMV